MDDHSTYDFGILGSFFHHGIWMYLGFVPHPNDQNCVFLPLAVLFLMFFLAQSSSIERQLGGWGFSWGHSRNITTDIVQLCSTQDKSGKITVR